jgi:hypothetical protein
MVAPSNLVGFKEIRLNVDKSKFGNMLVNILAVVILLGVIYAAVAYLIIPVSKVMGVLLVNSAKDGYHQFTTLVDTFMHWDMAIYLLLGLAVYLLPSILACMRKHPNKRSILVTNIMIGWSVIGWILALIWSYSTAESRRI